MLDNTDGIDQILKEQGLDFDEVIEYLRDLEEGDDPESPDGGLCLNFENFFDMRIALNDLLTQEVFKSWPHWSGNYSYPIPTTEEFFGEDIDKDIYDLRHENQFDNTENFWEDDDYGILRRKWCGHLANYFKNTKK